MVCTSVQGADDCYWHVPFAFLIHGNRLPSLRHDLCVRMHPFWVPRYPLDGLVLARFRRNAQDRSDSLWHAPLSMELFIGAGISHSTCRYVAIDWQSWDMTCISGCIPFRLHSSQQICWFWADLAKRTQQK